MGLKRLSGTGRSFRSFPPWLEAAVGCEPFHIGGWDASGIVYKVGDQVSGLSVGNEVVIAVTDPKRLPHADGLGRHAVRPNDVVLCWGGAGGL